MRQWVCTALVGEQGLRLREADRPECGRDQLLVTNHSAALNFPDLLITRGLYQLKLDPPFVPGGEFAGVIAEVGDSVTGFEVGDRVAVLSGVGAFAETVAVTPPAQQVHRIPPDMDMDDAAALLLCHGTAIYALANRGLLRADETVLVLGAAGGCGSAAIQVAKAMGARVIAGASSEDKCLAAQADGADDIVNYTTEDLRSRVKALTNGIGVDVVFDPVGGPLFDEARRCVAWDGRYLVIGFTGGIPTFPVNYSILKSMSLIGVAYGMSAIKDPVANTRNVRQLIEWYDRGLLTPAIGHRVPFEQLPDACRELHDRKSVGKTVIRLRPPAESANR